MKKKLIFRMCVCRCISTFGCFSVEYYWMKLSIIFGDSNTTTTTTTTLSNQFVKTQNQKKMIMKKTTKNQHKFVCKHSHMVKKSVRILLLLLLSLLHWERFNCWMFVLATHGFIKKNIVWSHTRKAVFFSIHAAFFLFLPCWNISNIWSKCHE